MNYLHCQKYTPISQNKAKSITTVILLQCNAEVLALIWLPFDVNHPFKHCCRPSTPNPVEYLWDLLETSPLTSQPVKELTEYATNTLVPDISGRPKRACVHGLTDQSQVWSTIGHLWTRLISGTSQCLIGLGSGVLETRWMPSAFCHIPQAIPEQFLHCCTVSCCPAHETTAIRGCRCHEFGVTWSLMMIGLGNAGQVASTWMQEPKASVSISLIQSISVIHFTCLWFPCCGWFWELQNCHETLTGSSS